MNAPIRVLVIDDRPVVLKALRDLVDAEAPRLKCVGAAANWQAGSELAKQAAAEVVVVGIDESSLDSGAWISQLVTGSSAKVLAIADSRSPDLYDRAMLEGARGVVDIHEEPATIVRAIERVHGGECWLDRLSTGRLLVKLAQRASGQPVRGSDDERIASLTDREKGILSAVCENSGSGAKVVADILSISESTLRNHLTSIYTKLGVANRVELLEFAYRNRLVKAVATR